MVLRWIRSDDPIPEGHIRLSEAFDLYYQAVTPHWRELDTAITDAGNRRNGKYIAETDAPFFAAISVRETARGEADLQFRGALASGALRGMIRDPKNGERLELPRNGWDKGADLDGGFSRGFDEDFVEPDDVFQPGPLATIDGSLRPVFFNRKDFQTWLVGVMTGGDSAAHKSIPIDRYKAQLSAWMADRKLFIAGIEKFSGRKIKGPSKAQIAQALEKWAYANFSRSLSAGRIENALREDELMKSALKMM